MKKIKGQKDLVNYSAKIALEFGNVARAILYSQIIYRRDIKQRSEFYKTDKERSLELWLWLSEIKYTKKRLKDNWYIITQHKRLDHSTSYIVEENQLNTLLIKLYWETYQNREHCQNWRSVESELTIGNAKNDDGESQNWRSVESELTIGNAKNDDGESQNWRSVESELTFDIRTETTTEITTESVEREEQPPPSQFDKIEFIWKMRDAEKRGSVYLSTRNKITSRNDFLTEEIKKKLFNFSNLSLQDFALRAEKFEVIKSLILAKKMEKYFFSRIRERDFGQFLAKFNDFWGTDEEIVSKLAIFTEIKKALRILATPEASSVPEQKPELTEEQRQEQKAKLEQAKQQLLSKLSIANDNNTISN